MSASSNPTNFPPIPPRYAIVQLLRQNQQTYVYRAEDTFEGLPVVLKILAVPYRRDEEIYRFQREFRMLGDIGHPNVVKVLDFGLVDGVYPYFTMEFVDGVALSERYRRAPWPDIYRGLIQICAGLIHIHNRGIIHLDIKPANILVTGGATPLVKIMDFGLSQEMQEVVDRRIRGTLHYMAPEILRQDRFDKRADLYSLGLSLYEVATQTLPTLGLEPIDIIKFQLGGEIPPPSRINPDIPRDFEHIILRLCEKEPRERYASATHLLEDVARLAGVEVDPQLLAGGGELLSPTLVGRNPVLDQLRGFYSGARTGRGRVALLGGEEGIGKSRVGREFRLHVQVEQGFFFEGYAVPNQKTPYKPFLDVVAQMLRFSRTAGGGKSEIEIELANWLEPPSGDAPEPRQAHSDPEKEKFRLFTLIANALRRLHQDLAGPGQSAKRPLAVLIEDIHWADRVSLELLAFLAREMENEPFVLLATFRPITDLAPEDDDEFATVFDELLGDPEILKIYLPFLVEEEVRILVGSTLGSCDLSIDFYQWIHKESHGNPSLVERVLYHVIQEKTLLWRHGRFETEDDWQTRASIPGGVANLLSRRLTQLSAEHLGVLKAAAVFADTFTYSTLHYLVEGEAAPLYEALNHLVDEQILELHVTRERTRYGFTHSKMKDIVYASMSEPEKRRMHERAARHLEKVYLNGVKELLGQVAFHYAHGESQEKGIQYSLAAAVQAEKVYALAQAAEFYRICLELMDLMGSEEGRYEAREKLGDVYYKSGNFRKAMQIYQFLLRSQGLVADSSAERERLRHAVITKKIGKVFGRWGNYDSALGYFHNALNEMAGLQATAQEVDLLDRLGWGYMEKGNYQEAIEYIERGLRLVEGTDLIEQRSDLLNTLGNIHYNRGDWIRAEHWLREGMVWAQKSPDARSLKVILTNLGNVLWKKGDWEQAMGIYQRSLDFSERAGDMWGVVTAYNNIAIIECSRGNWANALAPLQKSLAIKHKLGAIDGESLALANLGEVYEILGDWDRAKEHYTRVLTLHDHNLENKNVISCLNSLGGLYRKMGDLGAAYDCATKALENAERGGDQNLVADCVYNVSLIEKDRENWPDAFAHIARALKIYADSNQQEGLGRILTSAADLALRMGDSEQAQDYAERSRLLCERLGDRYELGKSKSIFGRIHHAGGERDLAEDEFRESVEILTEVGAQYELGRAFFEWGLRADENAEAISLLGRAIKIFDKLKAHNELERARGAYYHVKERGQQGGKTVVGLYEVAKLINSTLDYQEVLHRVLDVAIQRLTAERGMLILADSLTGEYKVSVARNINPEAEGEGGRMSRSIVNRVIQSGHSVLSANAQVDDRFLPSDSIVTNSIISMLCVPLMIKEKIAGAIYIDHRRTSHLFAEKDLAFLEAFADQSAIAIENARLYQNLEEARLRLSQENEELKGEILQERHLDSLVGRSDAVSKMQFTIKKAAVSASTVLIRGESGSGKGLVARLIHNVSPRRDGPFIKFNCAALPETLAESELFGHEKGAFTGADKRKLGRFEVANKGTIFLDEIGKISLAMQSKLLRVVEDKEFERVGGTQTIKTDVKIIAATNLDIKRAIEEGTFREDLYYRLNIIPLVLPPLRERKDDVPMLVEHFLKKICRDLGMEQKKIEPGVIDLFMRYEWPGNVRELEAAIHRAIVLTADDLLRKTDFVWMGISDEKEIASEVETEGILHPVLKKLQISEDVYNDVMARVDRQLIEQALMEAGGRIRETARKLGLARNTLKSKINKYGIVVSEIN